MAHDLRGDFRSAARLFLRAPGSAALIVFTLATAIGTATIGFTFADLALFRGLPVDDSSRVVSVHFAAANESNPRARVSAPDFLDLRARARLLERIAVFRQASAPLIVNGQSTTLSVSYATGDFFFAMGQTSPAAGRVFAPGDDVPGAPRVALLSHRYWQEAFSGRPSAIGANLQIGPDHYIVVGVVAPEVEFGNIAEIDVWLPLIVTGAEPRDVRNLRLMARLRAGVTFEQAAAEVAVLGDALAAEHPSTNAGWRVRLIPISELTGGPGFWVVVALFLLSIALLMAIATANVSNLMLLRTLARVRELAVRTALGAARGRLVRQLLIEGLAMSVVSAIAALAVAHGGLQLVGAVGDELIFRQLRIDEHEFAFIAALTLVCPLFFSLVPARLLLRADARQALADGGRTVTTSTRGRSALVVAQVALAVILLVASGLALRSITALYSRPVGLEAARLLIFTLDFNDVLYPVPAGARAEALRVQEALTTIDSVTDVAMVDALPILGSESLLGVTSSAPVADGTDSKPTAIVTGTTEAAASALGLRMLSGRWWKATETNGIVVGRETAVRFMGGVDAAVDGTLNLWRGGTPTAFRVIGVVSDVASGDAADWMRPRVWVPLAETTRRMTFVVRTVREPSTLTSEVRRVVATTTPAVPIERLSTMPTALERAAASDYVIVQVLAGFALLALVLAATGIFGVVSYSAAQRTVEFGTRMALGATTFDVMRLVARQSAVFLGVGLTLGLAGGLAVAVSMRSVLDDVSPVDPITLGGVSLLLAVVTLAATAMPAWRAGRIDPIAALRAQ